MEKRTTASEVMKAERRQRQIELDQPAIARLASWLHDESESPEEQQSALEQLMRALDRHWPHRPLFQRHRKP